jgi:HPt (histidine-containing phosphotransfer) domain-containing protein
VLKLPPVKEDLLALNPVNFRKMAHGDPLGLIDLAFDYFNDTRRLMTGWMALVEAGNFSRLRDELHRCKGGASLFGLERLVAIIGGCERPSILESEGFDLRAFEDELSKAEKAVMAMAQSVE